ncbi:hypothetical protein J6590_068026 [Homalodisca vitripennis]|nr:hypothetical protein J6590_068026 [Homalodisca vitripennis]
MVFRRLVDLPCTVELPHQMPMSVFPPHLTLRVAFAELFSAHLNQPSHSLSFTTQHAVFSVVLHKSRTASHLYVCERLSISTNTANHLYYQRWRRSMTARSGIISTLSQQRPCAPQNPGTKVIGGVGQQPHGANPGTKIIGGVGQPLHGAVLLAYRNSVTKVIGGVGQPLHGAVLLAYRVNSGRKQNSVTNIIGCIGQRSRSAMRIIVTGQRVVALYNTESWYISNRLFRSKVARHEVISTLKSDSMNDEDK